MTNTKNTRQWIYDSLGKIKKENAVSSGTALQMQKLEHWKPEDFA